MQHNYANSTQNQFPKRESAAQVFLTHCFFICLIALFLTISNAYNFARSAHQLELVFVWTLVVGSSAIVSLSFMYLIRGTAMVNRVHPVPLFITTALIANSASTIVLLSMKFLLAWEVDHGWIALFFIAFVKGLLPVTVFSFVYWKLVLRLPFKILPEPEHSQYAGITDASESSCPETKIILLRLPEHLRGEILCLQADDHYIHVHTPKGKSMILYRFGDAVARLENGFQVHRSWWAANNAVERLEKQGRYTKLVLINGMTIPVSQSYMKKVRETWSEQ